MFFAILAIVFLTVWYILIKHSSRKAYLEFWARNYGQIEPLSNHVGAPLRLRPYKPVFNLSLGLSRISISELIQIDDELEERLRLRKDIQASHPDSLGALAVSQDAVNELYTFLTSHYLPKRFPNIFSVSRWRSNLIHLKSDKTLPLMPAKSPEQTLRMLSTIIDEDFMILLPTDDSNGYYLCAYLACFASGFEIGNILGNSLDELHGEVPGYRDKLQSKMTRWFARLQDGQIFRRCNWTITLHDKLRNSVGENQHYEVSEGEPTLSTVRRENVDVSNAHLRTELQHIWRLPQTRAIIFTYKTYIYPLSQISAEGEGEALAAAVEGLSCGNSPNIARYKGAAIWGQDVCEYLREGRRDNVSVR